ncbi:hypothetical protein G6L37_01800 [Agrobacterium rubi]|nr:hypothetical protein [Agrobacterium rubi]NTF24127.1 hypothetical protein [Agrobacterium rubi]
MKLSRRTHLERNDGQLIIEFEGDGFVEHGHLPGIVDLREYLDQLQLHEKGALDSDGHRIPVTVLALSPHPASLPAVEHYMKTDVDGLFHAVWTAGDDKLEFMVAATGIEGMKALRNIYKAAVEGRAFAGPPGRRYRGLRLVAVEEACSAARPVELH